jgi:DNA-binding NarL/FixJ family response regulator
MATIDVVLAGGHPAVRQILRRILEQYPDIVVVAEAANGDEALRAAQRLRPQVLILDVELPGLSAGELVRRLNGNGAHTKVLAIGRDGNAEGILDILDAGACGYLTKKDALRDLPEAVRTVQAGGSWLGPSVLAGITGRRQPLALTPRQAQVLAQVADGATNKEIARTLDIDVKTVEKHIAAIFAGLGVSSRAQAVGEAIRLGLISGDGLTGRESPAFEVGFAPFWIPPVRDKLGIGRIPWVVFLWPVVRRPCRSSPGKVG